MPIKLEVLTELNQADKRDIDKIWLDNKDKSIGFLDHESLEHRLKTGETLFAGRFNDRIAGIILAQSNLITSSAVQSAGEMHLIFAAVRTITQGRGVMHQMLHHVQRWSDQQNIRLVVDCGSVEVTAALQHRGFDISDGQLVYHPNEPLTRTGH